MEVVKAVVHNVSSIVPVNGVMNTKKERYYENQESSQFESMLKKEQREVEKSKSNKITPLENKGYTAYSLMPNGVRLVDYVYYNKMEIKG